MLVVAAGAVGTDDLLATLSGTDPAVFALGPLGVVVAVACWGEAQRRLLVAAGATLSPRRGFLGYGTGMFAKQVLPGGHALGPGLLAYAFRSLTGRPYGETFAAVTVAELLNMIASVLAVAAGLLLLSRGDPSPALSAARTAALAVAALLGLVVTLAWYRRRTVAALLQGVACLVRGSLGRVSERVREAASPPAVAGALDRFYVTFDAVAAQPRRVGAAFAFTLVGWLAFVAPLYTSFLALDVALAPGVVLLVVPAAGLANAVPLPGGLGGAELAVGGALVALAGLDLPTAAAGVLLYRLCAFWFMAALGGLCAATLRVGVGEMAAGADRAETGAAGE